MQKIVRHFCYLLNGFLLIIVPYAITFDCTRLIYTKPPDFVLKKLSSRSIVLVEQLLKEHIKSGGDISNKTLLAAATEMKESAQKWLKMFVAAGVDLNKPRLVTIVNLDKSEESRMV